MTNEAGEEPLNAGVNNVTAKLKKAFSLTKEEDSEPINKRSDLSDLNPRDRQRVHHSFQGHGAFSIKKFPGGSTGAGSRTDYDELFSKFEL